MTKQQIAILALLLLIGYAVFAIGGYFIGANVTEQKWQARMDYVAYAEERVCHTRCRMASDMAAIAAAERLTDGICTNLREGEGAFADQVATWRDTAPPDDWQPWHDNMLKAMEVIHRSYQRFVAACDYNDNWEFDSSQAELGIAFGAMEPTFETLRPKHRPWAH